MKVVEFFMKRPTLFWSLTVGIILAGVLAFIAMPKLEDPAVPVKQAVVVVPYPGASAHQVELEVAQLMEDELRALPNVKKVKSECQNGSATITVEFQMTVLVEDLEQYFDQLRRKVNDVASRLPSGCYAPIVLDDMMDVYGIFYALTAEGYDYPEMYRYAKYIRRELLDVKGVKRISISGNRDEVINIILPKEQLARNGLIPTKLMTSLQSVGKPVNAGEYSSESEKIQLRVDSDIRNEEDIRDMLISTINGKQIRLGDIARVERGFSEPQRNGFFVSGKPALSICIAMEDDAIVPDVGKAVDARLAEVMETVPAGMQMEKIFFQPEKVSDAISSFMWNLLESVAIVILVLIFTMGFRSGVIIGFGLVLTVGVRDDLAAHFAWGVYRGNGHAGGQCRGDYGWHSGGQETGLGSKDLPVPHRAQHGVSLAGRDGDCRCNIPCHLSLSGLGRRVCGRPVPGALREPACQLGAGTHSSAHLCQELVAVTRRYKKQNRRGRSDELSRTPLCTQVDFVPH